MKKTLNEEKQRILQIMRQLNEQAFNDDGEPMMTHKQYSDYSEPSEYEYDDNNGHDGYEKELTIKDVVSLLEKRFNTKLENFGDEYYFITSKEAAGDMVVWRDKHNQIGAVNPNDERFSELDFDELIINDLFDFFEPYHQYILTGKELERVMDENQRQYSRDAEYARQERAAMGGGG